MMPPVLLAYNLDGQKMLRLRFACAQLKVLLRAVPKADYGQPLAALAGLRPRAEEAAPAGDFSDEMLVMANFNAQQFHALLDALRRDRVQSVALKAVLTPTNAEWDSVRLRTELLRERDALRGKGGSPAGAK